MRKIKIRMLALLLAGGLYICSHAVLCLSQTADNSEPISKIKVNLSTDKKSYVPGERIVFTYSVENFGTHPVYVHYGMPLISGFRSGFYVKIYSEDGKEVLPASFADGISSKDTPNTSSEQIFQENWFPLGPGNFYGNKQEFWEKLDKPGKYKLVGFYFDATLQYLTEQQRADLLKVHPAIIQGEFQSDPIWIEIQRK